MLGMMRIDIKREVYTRDGTSDDYLQKRRSNLRGNQKKTRIKRIPETEPGKDETSHPIFLP